MATPSINPTPSGGPKVILVVDDEPEILRLIEASLAGYGYQVVTAKGAEAAIREFERMAQPPDLILTDVVMPGMSGPMLVDHLLALRPGSRVLFMSGYDDRQVVQRYVLEKGFRLIRKPFTVSALRAAIQEVVNQTDTGFEAPPSS